MFWDSLSIPASHIFQQAVGCEHHGRIERRNAFMVWERYIPENAPWLCSMGSAHQTVRLTLEHLQKRFEEACNMTHMTSTILCTLRYAEYNKIKQTNLVSVRLPKQAQRWQIDLGCLLPMDKSSCRLQLCIGILPCPHRSFAAYTASEFWAGFSCQDTHHVLQLSVLGVFPWKSISA